MQKNVKKMSINYSPNFDTKKRSASRVKYLIFHYTGMRSENAAIKKLTNTGSKVSCHYFIKSNGEIIKNVSRTKNSDLYYGIPGTYGTMGIITRVKVKLIPCEKYVKINFKIIFFYFFNPMDFPKADGNEAFL